MFSGSWCLQCFWYTWSLCWGEAINVCHCLKDNSRAIVKLRNRKDSLQERPQIFGPDWIRLSWWHNNLYKSLWSFFVHDIHSMSGIEIRVCQQTWPAKFYLFSIQNSLIETTTHFFLQQLGKCLSEIPWKHWNKI